jgi:hypothetical protein
LKGPDRTRLEGVHQDVRVLYGQVYGWDPPQVEVGERLSTTRIRQYVRRWINEWDLLRLYPDYVAGGTVFDVLVPDYAEHPGLEAADESPESDADFER